MKRSCEVEEIQARELGREWGVLIVGGSGLERAYMAGRETCTLLEIIPVFFPLPREIFLPSKLDGDIADLLIIGVILSAGDPVSSDI